ncbi:MAG: efflux RND transporter periplasmic adaptor subunit [Robiginitomaculum sp.]|nr:efflux RND transporter periplasmic adaptor subunit [Robiginitomaculum sp.]
MKLFRPLYFILLFIGAVIAITVFAKANDSQSIPQSSPTPVSVLTVSFQEQLEVFSTWPATVMAKRQSNLGFERGGLIAQVLVDVGDKVQKGDKLASLNTNTQTADLAAAKASIDQAKANLDISLATTKRQQELANAGHISSQRLEEVIATKYSAEASFAAAKARHKAILARLELSHIIAPYDGTIIRRLLDEGSIFNPGATVLAIIESDELELIVGLPPQQAAALKLGEIFTVTTKSDEASVQLRKSTNIINPTTQTVTVVFDFIKEGNLPISGQSARIQLKDQMHQQGFLVPITALREGRRGLWTLYILEPKENSSKFILAPVPVEILHTGEEQIYVRGPVEDGTMFLQSSGQNTVVGMVVTPTNVSRK